MGFLLLRGASNSDGPTHLAGVACLPIEQPANRGRSSVTHATTAVGYNLDVGIFGVSSFAWVPGIHLVTVVVASSPGSLIDLDDCHKSQSLCNPYIRIGR
jgi:hypothetical protein